jgi:hypothetical protein
VKSDAALDGRGREAFLAALGDLLGRSSAGLEVEAALGRLSVAGRGSDALVRSVVGALRGGRNLAAALLEAGCVSPSEAEALRGLGAPEMQGAALRVLVSRRVRRRRWLRAMGAAASTPVALTLVTLLTLQAPLLMLDAVSPGVAGRPAGVLVAIGVALAVVVWAVGRRAGPTFWTRAAAWPLVGRHLARRAEIDLAAALAVLGHDDHPTVAAYAVAAAFVAPPGHADALRRLVAGGGAIPGPPDDPWHPALRLAILGGAASGRLRERCAAWAEEAETTLTARWVLGVRVAAYLLLVLASSWAVAGLLETEITLPGLEGVPALNGLDLADPAGALERLLMKELQ